MELPFATKLPCGTRVKIEHRNTDRTSGTRYFTVHLDSRETGTCISAYANPEDAEHMDHEYYGSLIVSEKAFPALVDLFKALQQIE